MSDIKKFAEATVGELDKLKGVKIERANLGPCPVCGRDVIENRKGYSCWSREDPGCGFVIWKKKAGKTLPASVVKELMESLRISIEAGDEHPVGRTTKPVTGFKGPLRALLPRQAARGEVRRRQVARGVRRGLGQRRHAAAGRGRGLAEARRAAATASDEAAADAAAETPEPEPVTSE